MAVGNTVKIVAISLLLQMPLALLLALLIYRKTPTNAIFRLIFFVPYILAEVAAGLIWSFVFDGNYGVTASIAQSFGIESFFILADRDWAFVADHDGDRLEVFRLSHDDLHRGAAIGPRAT